MGGKGDQQEDRDASPENAGRDEEEPGSQRPKNATNLMAYDVDAICNSRDFILVYAAFPIEVIIGTGFLYSLFGSCAFVALAVLCCSSPLAALLSRRMTGFQQRVMQKTDQRLSLIGELLNSIRTIKYLS